MVPVQFAAPLGLSDVDPVGSLVAGAGEALGLDEGFQQNGSVSVAVLPVLGELTRGQGQQLGGEVLGLDPGKDQETGVVDDQLKVPGWQIAIFLNILAVVTGIFLLSYRPITWGRLLGAIACAVVATFSFGNGLLLWWIGLLMLTVPWLKNRQTSITFPLSWLLAGSLLTGVYLNDFRVPSHHPSPWTLLEQPIEYVQYMLSFLGNPISTQYSLLMGFLGLIGVGTCLTLLVRCYAVQIEPLLPLIALFLYSVGSAALIGVGRLGFGVDQAGRSRYVTIANLCWIALIVLIALLFKVYRSRRPEGQTELAHSTYRRRRPYYLAGGVLLLVVASIFSVKTQLSSSRTNPLSLPDVHQFARRHMALTAARKELLILENDELLKKLHKNPRYLRHRIGILRTHGLSVFREKPGTGR